jgi:hypothetical protein
MEMMNIDYAIKRLGIYTSLLEGTRKLVLRTSAKTYADPKVAAHINSLRQDFEKLFEEAMIHSIILHRRMTAQVPTLVNFPAELAKFSRADSAFALELEESSKALLQLDPTCFDPKPGNSTKASKDA